MEHCCLRENIGIAIYSLAQAFSLHAFSFLICVVFGVRVCVTVRSMTKKHSIRVCIIFPFKETNQFTFKTCLSCD